MKKTLFTLIAISFVSLSYFAQNFEGEITYETTYKTMPEITSTRNEYKSFFGLDNEKRYFFLPSMLMHISIFFQRKKYNVDLLVGFLYVMI